MNLPFWKKKKNDKQNKGSLIKQSDYKELSYINEKTKVEFTIAYISSLVDEKIIKKTALPFLLTEDFQDIESVKEILPATDVQFSEKPDEKEEKLFKGQVILSINNEKKFCYFPAHKEVGRAVAPPEVEFSVVGPKEAFVESIDQNLNLLRKRVPVKDLVIEEQEIGSLSKTRVAIIYLEQVANEENLNTVKQRLEDIEFDQISDSTFIYQMITDNQNSLFPQLMDTERPDRVAASLSEGKIAILVDGAPHVMMGPSTFIEFFGSFEDYFINWITASFFRLIRIFAVLFSILITPLYVAVLSYHYELVPRDLLSSLIASRRLVPFPPFLEAVFLELTIELLREAGARLPTKVGQTIGIVGGIVIGTASVEAGLTSNVLLIFIALSALASFTTPVYRMGNTIRLLRFPFLILAELLGLVGILLGFCALLTHLIRLTSLGRPYLEPFYPPRLQDFKDSFIRLPFSKQSKRPMFLQTKDKERMNAEDAKKKKDIDE